MEQITQVKPPGPGFVNSEKSIEMAVRRLGETGMDRKTALEKIDMALYEVLHKLNGVGIRNTSILQQMSLAAGMKLNALRVAEANEEDAHDGI